jgi:hypothetical protein
MSESHTRTCSSISIRYYATRVTTLFDIAQITTTHINSIEQSDNHDHAGTSSSIFGCSHRGFRGWWAGYCQSNGPSIDAANAWPTSGGFVV